ncbi:UDP-glucose 4-epimerase GalE [Dyella solisilvae]|uniref:UDP-glucose 4-epimerase n=1 Tax=Dyella solisilvae TaxID=1920168 RepID=A0A370K7K5_9GAMM|nr:UDP-glucose 4-epimerase GalE [Dyella solisilvae]RDI98437.1 UDP-glucose 4-epimerase GalE [Dyella solisilvae]
MHVLICGGAGYVGSHMAKCLSVAGHEVTVLDNLRTGHREAVKWGDLAVADLLDERALSLIFSRTQFDAVMHFSALSLVGESVTMPYEYYATNVTGTVNLLRAMRARDVRRLVFSSTAAVYGQPQSPLIDEDHPKLPMSPYGASKLMVERVLSDAAAAYGLRSAALRYFNAAGASADGDIGEAHHPETHLIPNVLRSVLGQGGRLKVFGGDYTTPDGTCVRDYVHVDDLADAHLRALHYLNGHDGAHAFNLGNGQGFSVREVIATVQRVTGCDVPFEMGARRSGDPAVLVAASAKAKTELGWEPRHSGLDTIIESAWRWHSNPAF